MAITVGLAGITGKFGRCLATQLLKNPNISLRGYARDPTKVASFISSSPRVQLHWEKPMTTRRSSPSSRGATSLFALTWATTG